MRADEALVREARALATGAEIHRVEKWVALYRNASDGGGYRGRSRGRIRALMEGALRGFIWSSRRTCHRRGPR